MITLWQGLWIGFGVFVVGLFFGCNLGVILMCVLQMAGREGKTTEVVTTNG